MKEKVCQCVSGVKAFKGKGEFRDGLFSSEACLQQMHVEMEQLSSESRAIEKRLFYLEVHKPITASCYRAWKLRWRLSGDRNGHTNWNGLASRMQRMSIAERTYYESLNERMQELNVLETVVRTQCKWLREHLEQQGEVIPRSDQVIRMLNKVGA